MATTGSIFAAIEAGMIPDRMPNAIQIVRAITIILGAMKMGKGSTPLNTTANIHTKKRPINPPTIQRKALSIKNSVRMVLLFAPIAFLKRLRLLQTYLLLL